MLNIACAVVFVMSSDNVVAYTFSMLCFSYKCLFSFVQPNIPQTLDAPTTLLYNPFELGISIQFTWNTISIHYKLVESTGKRRSHNTNPDTK